MAMESTQLLHKEHLRKNNTAVYVAFFFPALAGMMYGYDIGAASPAILSFSIDTPLTSLQQSLFTSSSLIGAVAGSILTFWVGEPLGRRREVIVASVLYVLGTAICLCATGSAAFGVCIFGRVVYGFGIAFAMHAAPAYIAEMAPSDLRGMLISLKEAFVVFGVLLAYIVAAITEHYLNDRGDAWRIIWSPPLIFASAGGIGMLLLPASPRWLVSRGRMEEATESLRMLRVDAALPMLRCLAWLPNYEQPADTSAAIEAEISDMVFSLRISKRTVSLSRGMHEADADAAATAVPSSSICGIVEDIKDLASAPRALMLGFGLVLLQQLTGQPNVLYYVQSIFESAGFTSSSASNIDILVGAIKLVSTLAVVPFVDRSGRVPLLNIGVTMMLFALIVLCLGFALNPTISGMVFLEGGWPYAVVTALIVFVTGYQVGFGPITWVMISECFPLQLRVHALSVAATLNFGFNLIVTLINAPIASVQGGQATLFGVYAFMCVVALLFFRYFVPETKGKSLEEIDAMMRRPWSSDGGYK